jgi:hypothetical protein
MREVSLLSLVIVEVGFIVDSSLAAFAWMQFSVEMAFGENLYVRLIEVQMAADWISWGYRERLH